MNIRSVTLGLDKSDLFNSQIESQIDAFFKISNEVCAEAGRKVRTNRISLPPFNHQEEINISSTRESVRRVADICRKVNARWFCVPFSTFGNGDFRVILDTMLEIIKRYPSSFINIIVARDRIINLQGILHASKFIQNVSRLTNNGYDNFRVGVSCNCLPNSPFFPFTYQEGARGFSIALELTGTFCKILKGIKHKDLVIIRELLIKEITPLLEIVEDIGREAEKKTSVKYNGTDISLAPFPGEDNSVAQLIEMLGVENFGGNGTLYITSYLTDVLKALIKTSKLTSIGFNGVMFSLLEDSGVGKRNNSRRFSIDSLLAYSSVCGCGIDMIPISGDTFEEEIASLILDVAAISCSLDKPLGVRLLPVPLKGKNEYTDYNYDFLYNTRIKGLGSMSMFLETFDSKNFTYYSFH